MMGSGTLYHRFKYASCLLQFLFLLPFAVWAKDDEDDDKEQRSVIFTGSWADSSLPATAGKNGPITIIASSIESSVSSSAARVTSASSNQSVSNGGRPASAVKAPAVSAAPVARLLRLPDAASLKEKFRKVLKSGAVLMRCHVQYNNFTVYGDVVTVRFEKSGTMTGKYKGNPNCTLSPSQSVPRISEADALARVIAIFNLSINGTNSYRLKDVKIERVLKSDSSVGQYRLCYRVSSLVESLNGSAILVAPYGLVDAVTGSVISAWNGIPSQSALSTSNVISGVGGNGGLGGSSQPATYTDVPVSRFANGRCAFNGTIVQVQNMRGAVSGAFVPASFNCADALSLSADKANGGYSPMNDVARHTAVTVRMYQDYLGIDGPTGSLPLKARVHFGVNYENAYYDGTYANFGDGYQTLYPLTSLQVVAHEFSHGFTSSNSGLEYFGQSGGISESFSDMAGVAALYYDTGRVDFTFGASIVKAGIPIRYLCTPRYDGRSIDNITQFKTGMDPHYSSGVYNKVFCILSKTLDVPTAFQLFAVANAFYWSQMTTFVTGTCGVLSAAQDMNLNQAVIVSAFKAVGLACPY